MAPEEFVTKDLCGERSGNIIEKVSNLKDTVENRFEHIDKKLDRLLNGGGNHSSINMKVMLAIIAGINVFIAGVIEIIRAIAK